MGEVRSYGVHLCREAGCVRREVPWTEQGRVHRGECPDLECAVAVQSSLFGFSVTWAGESSGSNPFVLTVHC